MGYTHYWEVNEEITDNEWEQIRQGVSVALSVLGNLVQEERDIQAPPIISERQIRFNGIDNAGHETFLFNKNQNGFEFCKTAQKPYDLAVYLVLLICKAILGKKMSLRSDGGYEDWEPACKLFGNTTRDFLDQ